MKSLFRSVLLLLLVAGCSTPDHEPLSLSLLFSDNAVLQRDAPIRIWGRVTGGEDVTVAFADQSKRTTAEEDGTWRLELAPRPAGGPYTLTVESGIDRIERAGIWMGDVWIASGQSNMEWPVWASANAEQEIQAANDPMIRHFKVPRTWSYAPETTLAGGEWQVASPETVGDFSAVAYFFARQIRTHHDVPIGILNTSWGGSRIEPWMSAETLGMSPEDVAALQQEEISAQAEAKARLEAQLGPIPAEDPGLVNGEAVWASPDLDLADWDTLSVPGNWESQFPGVDGIAWYRTVLELSADEAAGAAVLGAGQIDDSDITWINGLEVGRTEQDWQAERRYVVPTGTLKEGKNVIAVRVEDTGGGGGFHGLPDLVYLEIDGERRGLAGTWSFRFGKPISNVGFQRNHTPTLLYNKMIQPLVPYPVAGFLWYQGESNAGEAEVYRDLFQDLIASWRSAWTQGDLPFLWVQLANFMAADPVPTESNWAVLRESQSAALELPNTGQAVIIDIGEADDIHPRNKQDVGYRLSLPARRLAYGETDLLDSGPIYRTHRVEGSRVVLEFDHVGSGLMARGDRLGGFAISGADGRWVWANARIVGNSVTVTSDQVSRPENVRYAWGNNPDRANLYNREGLPAGPFRTDAP